MHNFDSTTLVLASLSKHRIGGIIVIVLGALVLVIGGARMMGRVATAPLLPLIGLAVVVLGILVFARVI